MKYVKKLFFTGMMGSLLFSSFFGFSSIRNFQNNKENLESSIFRHESTTIVNMPINDKKNSDLDDLDFDGLSAEDILHIKDLIKNQKLDYFNQGAPFGTNQYGQFKEGKFYGYDKNGNPLYVYEVGFWGKCFSKGGLCREILIGVAAGLITYVLTR